MNPFARTAGRSPGGRATRRGDDKSRPLIMFFVVLAAVPLTGCQLPDLVAKPELPFPVETRPEFTVVLLPDTQYYSLRDSATYTAQTQWIVDHQAEKNIQFVIHLGDITHENTNAEWDNASAAHAILDAAGIPYSVIPGNHDNPDSGRKRDTTRYNNHFGPGRFSGDSWYGGHMGSKNDNNYSFFEVGKLKFMVVGLEFAPTKQALCWADDLIQSHPDRRVIIVTHCHQDKGGDHRNDCASAYGITGSAGLTTWKELARRHNNVAMVLSGHVGDSELMTRTGNGGNAVYEILTDYQFEQRGGQNHGNGWMRTLRFVPADDLIHVDTFTVLSGVTSFNRPDYPSSPSDPAHRYSIAYDMTSRMSSYAYTTTTDAFDDMTVNTDANRQQKDPEVAMAPDGDFVVVWEDDSKGAEHIYQIYARGFSAGGCEKFPDITVNAVADGNQHNPAVAMAPDGDFVVVWEDDSNDNGIYQIYAAGFSGSGARRFSDITVNADATGQQRKPVVGMADNGSFVVAWEDDRNDNGIYQILAAGFDASGARRFGDITVNQVADGEQLRPSIAVNTDGSFVVAWEDDNNDNHIYQIYAAGFSASGARRFNDITVNADATGQQLKPVVGMADNGSFVVAWEDDRNDNGIYQILAAGFDASGARRFGDITVNRVADGEQRRPAIAVKPDGSFVVAWEDDNDDNDFYQIYVAGFSASGVRQFGDNTVNSDSSGQQYWPDIAIDADGRYVVVWQDDLDGNNYYQILARGLEQ